MTTVVACPACQQNLQVPPEQLGRDVRCPGCAHIFAAVDTAVRPAAPPPVPADVPARQNSPEEELATPLEDAETAQAEEAERRRRMEQKKARKTDTSTGGYFGELARRQRKMQSEHRGPLVLI